MKKAILSVVVSVIILVVGTNINKSEREIGIEVGATVVSADDGEAVGIIVKNGNKMDQVLSQFTRVTEDCDPNEEATSTPQTQCERVYYQNRPVNVFYSVPRVVATKRLFETLGDFPFAGGIDYINRSDTEAEDKLIEYMLNNGNGSYTIIYEP